MRKHGAEEPWTLNEYRDRYALYKSDPDLKRAHAAFPWIVTWDDHEVQNDYANDRSQSLDPPEEFLDRRAAAYRAYYEHMPLPKSMQPQGPDMRIFTRAGFGELATLHVLDDRQYRSHQVCPREGRGGSNVVPSAVCPQLYEPGRTMLGPEQEQWLHQGLAGSRARWNVIVQQTMMAQVDRKVGEGQAFWTDGWDGYPKRASGCARDSGKQRRESAGHRARIHTFGGRSQENFDIRRRRLLQRSCPPRSLPRESGKSSSKTGVPKTRTSATPTAPAAATRRST